MNYAKRIPLLFRSQSKKMSSAAAAGSKTVEHDVANKAFVLTVPEGRCLAEYQFIEENKKINVYHTETPPAARGQGLAEYVMRATVSASEELGWEVVGSCSYADKIIRKIKAEKSA
jgi:predicted GNAT family acetyltransferase